MVQFNNGTSNVALEKIVALDAGAAHVCAVQVQPGSNPRVLCWGKNEFSQVTGDISGVGVGAGNKTTAFVLDYFTTKPPSANSCRNYQVD